MVILVVSHYREQPKSKIESERKPINVKKRRSYSPTLERGEFQDDREISPQVSTTVAMLKANEVPYASFGKCGSDGSPKPVLEAQGVCIRLLLMSSIKARVTNWGASKFADNRASPI
jgi:hypothetical protein